jgi:hypothetical protein
LDINWFEGDREMLALAKEQSVQIRLRAGWRWSSGRPSGVVLALHFWLLSAGWMLGQRPCGLTTPTDSALRPWPPRGATTPLTILAFGTSLMWGDGLKQSDTFRYKVADWVALQVGRPVQLTTFAHSSALLSPVVPGSSMAANPAPSIGDLNSALPSVDEQIECAANSDSFRGAALVLVEGCINEVGAEAIVYPWTEPGALRESTNRYCGDPFFVELEKIRQYFPRAIIVVAGYYPLVSMRSSAFGFSGTRRLASRATKVYARRHTVSVQQQKRRRPRKEEHNIMVENSEVFYQTSKTSLESAVSRANANGETTIFFAQMPEPTTANGQPTMDPLFAYGAPLRHQWMISFRFLHFWAFYKDEKYWFRQPLCDEYVPVDDISGLIDRMVCQTNAAFHPNVEGAQVYAKSIEAIIPGSAVSKWKLDQQ